MADAEIQILISAVDNMTAIYYFPRLVLFVSF